MNVRRYAKVKLLDARTLEGKTERRTIRDLTEHVGGSPSAPQRILIARAARLLVMVELMEKKLIENDEASDHASRQILAWVNSLRLIMHELGIERPQAAPQRLAEVMRIKAA